MTREQLFALLVFFGSLALLVVWLAVFDLWLYFRYGAAGTISRAMQYAATKRPIFAFLVGFVVALVIGILAGHFFWPQPPIQP